MDNFMVSTEVALLHSVAKNRKINLWDYVRIHDECITYLNSLKNGYCDCTAKVHPEYRKFIDNWDGYPAFNSEHLKETIKFLNTRIDKIEEILKLDSEILDAQLKTLNNHEIRQKSSEVDIVFRDFWNSQYNHVEIPVTLREWVNKSKIGYIAELKEVEEKSKLSAEDIENIYRYNESDMDKVIGLFRAEKGKEKIEEVLKSIVSKLENEKQERAYIDLLNAIIEVYIDSDISLDTYWLQIIERRYSFRKTK